MTINNDIQSLQNIEHYLQQTKTETQIILEQLTKHLQQNEIPITLTHQPLTHTPQWTTKTTTWNIKLTQTHLHTTLHISKNNNHHHHTYELANPDFPDNLTQDIKNQ